VATIPHNKTPHNNRTRIASMAVSLRSKRGAQRTFQGREIEQSGYWKLDVDMSIVRIDGPLFLVKNDLR